MAILAAVNWYFSLFLLFAVLACVFSLLMLFTSNIVRMAFYLTLALGATAGLFMLAGAHFLGAMQLMIYVGGTLVLLIFGVMLTAQGPFISLQTHSGEWILALVVGGSLLTLLLQTAFSVEEWQVPNQAAIGRSGQPTAAELGMGLLGVRVDRLEQDNKDLHPGMSGYLLPFEIVSVHLVVVLVGAAYLARARRRRQIETRSI